MGIGLRIEKQTRCLYTRQFLCRLDWGNNETIGRLLSKRMVYILSKKLEQEKEINFVALFWLAIMNYNLFGV